MNPVIDRLFKTEQVAKDMKSDVDAQKEKIRLMYQKKQQDFDKESDQETEEELARIRAESGQIQAENGKQIYAQSKKEIDLLENVYRKKKDQIVNNIFKKIIKG